MPHWCCGCWVQNGLQFIRIRSFKHELMVATRKLEMPKLVLKRILDSAQPAVELH